MIVRNASTQRWFDLRRRMVFGLFVDGYPTKQIALVLSMSDDSVKQLIKYQRYLWKRAGRPASTKIAFGERLAEDVLAGSPVCALA